MHLVPVILCGGSGTRLWPLSREQYPKQLLKLVGDCTMLQATARRLTGLPLREGDRILPPILVGNEEYRFLIAEQLRQIGIEHALLMLEPCGRNTAPALTLAALAARLGGDDPVMVVMPSDHIVQDERAFHDALQTAVLYAEAGKLVTFGINPTAAETGYGYIKLGAPSLQGCEADAAIQAIAYDVARFVEKPDLATAEQYLASGQYLWNSGIFVIKVSTWLNKMEQCSPEISDACGKAFAARQQDMDFIRPDKQLFSACPSDSIDYAVMERLASPAQNSREVVVVPLDARWSDVGAWSALWEIGEKDGQHNVLMGDVLAIDTRNTLAVGNGRLIACVGLDDMVVVETPDAILVADKTKIQMVKEVVAQLKQMQRAEFHSHRKVYRPWGWYDAIDCGQRFQVKRLMVTPGASLSLQMHHHRAEHWVVVSGTAKVTRGQETILLSENQSTYIPLGEKHRLENPGKTPLEIIEVQSGSYLGEDDIVRFEDIYRRDHRQ